MHGPASVNVWLGFLPCWNVVEKRAVRIIVIGQVLLLVHMEKWIMRTLQLGNVDYEIRRHVEREEEDDRLKAAFGRCFPFQTAGLDDSIQGFVAWNSSVAMQDQTDFVAFVEQIQDCVADVGDFFVPGWAGLVYLNAAEDYAAGVVAALLEGIEGRLDVELCVPGEGVSMLSRFGGVHRFCLDMYVPCSRDDYECQWFITCRLGHDARVESRNRRDVPSAVRFGGEGSEENRE